MSSYKGMFEASTISVDDFGEPIKPYFDEETLKNYVKTYLEPNIEKYVNEYAFTIDLIRNDETSKYAREVRLCLYANINYLFKYEKSRVFTILGQEDL